jgi:hypothetical protein
MREGNRGGGNRIGTCNCTQPRSAALPAPPNRHLAFISSDHHGMAAAGSAQNLQTHYNLKQSRFLSLRNKAQAHLKAHSRVVLEARMLTTSRVLPLPPQHACKQHVPCTSHGTPGGAWHLRCPLLLERGLAMQCRHPSPSSGRAKCPPR